jgi:UDP-N-acetylglucosamine 3-dehydrogenase
MAQESGATQQIDVGVLGIGYMGRNHARILSDLPGAKLVGVYDSDAGRAAEVAAEFETRAFDEAAALVEACRALVIAVPTDEHYSYAVDVLNAGRDILVEKPITDDLEQASSLCSIAREKGLILQVGHIERFNPVALELPRLVKDPIYISCERLSHFIPDWQGKTSVVLDLMIHDLDIVLSLIGKPATIVNAVCSEAGAGPGDLAIAQVKFDGGTIANFVASRVSQAKVRRISVTQHEEVIGVDLLRQTVAVHHLISNDYFYDTRMGYKQETVTEIPYLSKHGEPLRFELESFVESVATREPPIVSGEDGMKALALAMEITNACR